MGELFRHLNCSSQPPKSYNYNSRPNSLSIWAVLQIRTPVSDSISRQHPNNEDPKEDPDVETYLHYGTLNPQPRSIGEPKGVIV